MDDFGNLVDELKIKYDLQHQLDVNTKLLSLVSALYLRVKEQEINIASMSVELNRNSLRIRELEAFDILMITKIQDLETIQRYKG